jgi:hypothetical protein
MPFCAMPFGDRDAKTKLHKFLRIQGVPSLFMYGPRPPDGSDRPLINPFVRCIIENENYISEFPFHPKPYGDIDKTLRPINGHKCIVVFHEAGDDQEQEEVQEIVRMASQKYDGKEPIHMYWALCNNGFAENLRSALRLGRPQDEPTVVLLDIPDHGAFYLRGSTGELTPDSILDFLKSPGKRLQI